MVEGEDILKDILEEQSAPKADQAEERVEPCRVIEVDWILREADGKLGYTGWRVVAGRPKQHLMVEVVDAKKGIQSKMFERQCRHVAKLMGVKDADLTFSQDQSSVSSGS